MRIVPRTRVDQLGEGPLWSPSQNAVFWVDIIGRKLNRLALADDTVTSWDIPEMIGWVIERRDQPGFVAGLQSGFARLSLDPLEIAAIVDPEPHLPGNRMNDAKADARGRIFAGTMAVEIDSASGSLYRLDPDGSVVRLDTGYMICNGPAISPDGDYLLHTDSALGRIYRFDLAPDGSLGPRRLFREFADGEGKPDGMTFDAGGGLWVAQWGAARLARYTPDGRLDRHIDIPAAQVTSCCFAGPGLDRMFVTSAAVGDDAPGAGALFEVDPGCTGLVPHRFAG